MLDHAGQLELLRERIPERALRFTFSHSGGPGGQNVNKVATRATLWFNLNDTPLLDAYEKSRIRSAYPGRIGLNGCMRVTSMRHRTQSANRRACIERFLDLVAEALTPKKTRRKTRVPRAVRRRRIENKKKKGEIKRLRQRPLHPND